MSFLVERLKGLVLYSPEDEGGAASLTAPEATAAPEAEETPPEGEPSKAMFTDPEGEPNDEDPAPEGDSNPSESLTDPSGDDDGDGVPESYDIEKLSEGLPEGIEMDSVALEHFSPVLRELGVDEAGALRLIEAQAELDGKRGISINQQIEAQRTSDDAAVRKDPDIGGDNFDVSMSNVARVMSIDGGAEAHDILMAHGIDNNPAIVKFMSKVGALFAEDSLVNGKPNIADEMSDGDKMFPLTRE